MSSKPAQRGLDIGHVVALMVRAVVRRPVTILLLLVAYMAILYGLEAFKQWLSFIGRDEPLRDGPLAVVATIAVMACGGVAAARAMLRAAAEGEPAPIPTGRLPTAFLAAATLVAIGHAPIFLANSFGPLLPGLQGMASLFGLARFATGLVVLIFWAPAIAGALTGGGSLAAVLGRTAALTSGSRLLIGGFYVAGVLVSLFFLIILGVIVTLVAPDGMLLRVVVAYMATALAVLFWQLAGTAVHIDLRLAKGLAADGDVAATFD
ncbi:hypothetical protein QO010_003587 [Caulobacter ginsengisoli]|uniref:DUF4013 domain-containing protein n=1 Tax=Caulobacter ginsengisoli TaxID=400775 RepID=A0ABU0IWP8_9CAUL|nr:hypothetical protein [Caulobacter ginsengisoli]MDQ0465795.1 hypothetical protein [Caulobacter ginsengisoli]